MKIKIRDLPEMAIVPIPELEAFVVRRGGEVYVYRDECPHAFCNFTTAGQLEGDHIVCTCHWCKFDLRTGASMTPELTAEPLRKIGYRVEGEYIVFT